MKKNFLEKLAKAKNSPLENTNQKEEENNADSSNQGNNNYEGQLTIDVYQTLNEIVIKSTIAGVKPEDLDVNINNDMLTIKGTRRNEARIKPEDYYYQECYWGPFSRSILFPEPVDVPRSSASIKQGMLTIVLPKAIEQTEIGITSAE